jgi:hypothetical protein
MTAVGGVVYNCKGFLLDTDWTMRYIYSSPRNSNAPTTVLAKNIQTRIQTHISYFPTNLLTSKPLNFLVTQTQHKNQHRHHHQTNNQNKAKQNKNFYKKVLDF